MKYGGCCAVRGKNHHIMGAVEDPCGVLNRSLGDPCESGSHEAGVADQLPI